MLQVKIKGDFSKIIKSLEAQKDALDGKTDFYTKLGQLINSSIQIRVQRQGIGSDGQKMSPYKDKYEAWKKDRGRNVNFRDLTFQGNMWKSLTVENKDGGARLFFNSAAEANKARGNEARTPFFGISNRERDIIKREMRKLINGA